MKVQIEDLAEAVMKGLIDYADLASDEVKKEVRKTGNKIKKEIQANALVGKTGKYKDSWSVKTQRETSNSLEVVVHSKNRYQLAHLLEKGHVLRQGGRVCAKPHIAPAEEKGIQEMEENIRRRLKNG